MVKSRKMDTKRVGREEVYTERGKASDPGLDIMWWLHRNTESGTVFFVGWKVSLFGFMYGIIHQGKLGIAWRAEEEDRSSQPGGLTPQQVHLSYCVPTTGGRPCEDRSLQKERGYWGSRRWASHLIKALSQKMQLLWLSHFWKELRRDLGTETDEGRNCRWQHRLCSQKIQGKRRMRVAKGFHHT